MATALKPQIEMISDNNGGLFMENNDNRVKALLFAPIGMLKLRLVFRSLAYQYRCVCRGEGVGG